MAQYKNIEPRKVAMGDYIICDYECFDDGKLVDKNDKLWLYISEQLEPKELLNALVGTELGTTKEVEVAYPQSYQYKELAGKNRVYKVTPKQIKEKILPDINDDLAKETGHFSDLNGLREHLRKVIYSTKKRESQADVESQIFNTLLKNHVFEIPSSMVERQAAQLAEDAKHQLLHQGYKKEDLEKEDGKIKEGVKSQAKNNVKLFFIIEKIARSENINITDEELDEKIDQIAKSTKEPTAEVRKKLDENGLIENLREQMLHDKVVEFLIKEADRAKP
jgi:trigger factor